MPWEGMLLVVFCVDAVVVVLLSFASFKEVLCLRYSLPVPLDFSPSDRASSSSLARSLLRFRSASLCATSSLYSWSSRLAAFRPISLGVIHMVSCKNLS